MKKLLKVLLVVFVLFLAVLIILPFALRGKVEGIIKDQANAHLNARLDFNSVSLGLLRSFPHLSVHVYGLNITGIDAFEGDTLTHIEDLGVKINLMKILFGNKVEIKSIALDRPYVHVKVLADGRANYDIAKESDTPDAPQEDSGDGAPLQLDIKEYTIHGGRIVYDDATLPMRLALMGLEHTGSGNLADDVFTLYTSSSIAALDVVYDGVRYLKNVKTDLKADLAMDMNAMKFTFMENELAMNRMVLGFDGWLAMPGDDIDMDLAFAAKRTDLLTLLSLVPADFTTDLEGVQTTGTIAFNGYVKGRYNDASMPGFGVKLSVNDGTIKYPDLPKSIENIDIQLAIAAPEGNDLDLLTVDMPRFYMEIGKAPGKPNTLDATLYLRTPMSDPDLRTRLNAHLDLGTFKDVVPMDEAFELAGLFTADFALEGKLSDIENQRLNQFKAEGSAALDNLAYSTPEMAVAIPEARVLLTPQRLLVETFRVSYDEINMQLDGHLNNYVAYALKDTTLEGVFNFSADRIDANKYMAESDEPESAQAAAEDSTELGIIEVPGNVDLVLNSRIGEIVYGDMVLKNIAGQITVRENTAALRKLTFETLGGTVQMDGAYSTKNPEVPHMDFTYDIRNIDLRETANAMRTVEKMAPIAKHASGKMSSAFTLSTDLDSKMEPIYATMQGRGNLRSQQIVLEGGKFLQKLSSTLQSPQLARQEIRDLNATFVIKDGRINTDPFDVKINKMTANISGYSSFDETIDYLMKMKIPRAELGGDFNKMAEGLMAQANAFLGGSLKLGETIDVNVRIHGNLYDPTITPGFPGMDLGTNLKDQVMDQVKQMVTEKVEEVKDKVREEALKRAEQILADAQHQADRIRSEAANAARIVREEGDRNAQRLMDEAKNPVAKAAARPAADKVRSEANKRAAQIESEADKQAEAILSKARTEADKLKAD
jgi:hypothetical protein